MNSVRLRFSVDNSMAIYYIVAEYTAQFKALTCRMCTVSISWWLCLVDIDIDHTMSTFDDPKYGLIHTVEVWLSKEW